MAAIFGEGNIFWKLPRVHSSATLWVENFDEIALSHTVKEIQANLCFVIFGKNSKIQNGRHFWGGEIFFENCQEYIPQIMCTSKISTKSLYLARLRRQKQICVLPFLAKIRKFKMAAIFGEGKNVWKLARVHSSDTLWVENFDKIALSPTVQANLCFRQFCLPQA